MKRKTFILIILSSLIFIIALGIVIILNKPNTEYGNKNELNITNQNYVELSEYSQENIVQTNSSKITLSPNAKLVFTRTYSICRHSIKNTENISNEMVNLDFDAFSKLYSDWKITKFEQAQVELEKEISGYCDEHYLVKDLDGVVAIYKIDQSDNLHLESQTEILTKYLPEGDLKDLYEGVVIYGKNNLNAYLENFE